MEKYEFNPEEAYCRIEAHWKQWAHSVGAKEWVIGISGGKDSTVVAALAAKIFGKETVIGVMMPNGFQKDIADSKEICNHIGINSFTVNIGSTYDKLVHELYYSVFQFEAGIVRLSDDTTTNLPARLRMCTLYAVAQTVGGMVLNTCNLSEDVVGYATLYGDNAGSYAPIQGLTVTEVIALGDWLGLPHNLTHKTPIDGLQPKSDEEKLGFTYADLDKYIREDKGSSEFKKKINELYLKNKFKTDIVHLPGPDFGYLGNFVRYNNLPDVKVAPEEDCHVVHKYRDCINWSNNDHCAKTKRNCCTKDCEDYRPSTRKKEK